MKSRGKLHRYFYLVIVFLCFLPFWPWLLYLAKNPERHFRKFVRIRRWLALSSSWIAGFRFQIASETAIDWSQPYILCPNHSSNLDIPALIMACPVDFSFMGKDELLRNPVTGIYFKTIDIPVRRESKLSGFRAFKKAEHQLRKGRSMVIFPEGGITETYPPELVSFKTGPFRLAADLQIPIIPVVIHDAWKLFWDDGTPYGSRPGTIHVDLLAPLFPRSTHGNRQLEESESQRLLQETFRRMQNRLHEGPMRK